MRLGRSEYGAPSGARCQACTNTRPRGGIDPMRPLRFRWCLLALIALAAGCGAPQSSGDGRTAAPPSTPATGDAATSAAAALPANLDQGPRAGESAVDEAKVEAGE